MGDGEKRTESKIGFEMKQEKENQPVVYLGEFGSKTPQKSETSQTGSPVKSPKAPKRSREEAGLPIGLDVDFSAQGPDGFVVTKTDSSGKGVKGIRSPKKQ